MTRNRKEMDKDSAQTAFVSYYFYFLLLKYYILRAVDALYHIAVAYIVGHLSSVYLTVWNNRSNIARAWRLDNLLFMMDGRNDYTVI